MTARTPAGAPPRAARITILDILRALALLGIVTVHAHDHFNLYLPMPPAEGWQAAANSAADWAYEHLFVSKSFLLFSFLFGLSFFIQLDRQEQKGVDFRKRFMWRLALLFTPFFMTGTSSPSSACWVLPWWPCTNAVRLFSSSSACCA